jgi:PleD family two-component response regulator
MTVESTLGMGTTFYLYLPSTAKKVKSEPQDLGLFPFQEGKGRILVMDDDAGVRQVAGKILAHLGYEAEFAVDGAEAIDKYRGPEGRPAL